VTWTSSTDSLPEDASRYDGILNLWKPPGMTSHDVVSVVRRLTGQRRVGHAGTLDPMAEGVLVVGIGQGTRLLEYLAAGSKEYCARIHLGAATDTDDAEGVPIAVTAVKRFRRPSIERALSVFVGRQEQKPPVYSALKQHGQPAYRLARAGAPVRQTTRTIEIESIRLVSWRNPHIICVVTCSKGTYIRALARDVGAHLGCGAHLCGLIRLRSGAFALEDAVPLPLLAHALQEGYWQQIVLPLDAALEHHPALILGEEDDMRLREGKDIVLAQPPTSDAVSVQPWRAYNGGGELVALLNRSEHDNRWHGSKVFAPTHGIDPQSN
jgi:tRNA pseudouridine55 synthase